MNPEFHVALGNIRDNFLDTKGDCPYTEKDYQEYLIELWNLCQTVEDSVMEFTALIANELHSANMIIDSGEREIYRLGAENRCKQKELDELRSDCAALKEEKQITRLLCCLLEKEMKKND
jgi:hypothetical protein